MAMTFARIKTGFKQNVVYIFLVLAIFSCILLWRQSLQANKPSIDQLPAAPSESSLPFIVSSDRAFVYRLILFWLQQFDVQAGQYISYKNLNYQSLISWLDVLSQMDTESQYPMLLATRIYTKVGDEKKIRLMLDYIHEAFKKNPAKNWRWLAEATVTARHKLKDTALALKYATDLSESSNKNIPFWAKDMRLTLLEDMGEYEQLRLIVGGLLSNNQIKDANEIRFLDLLLKRLQKNHN